MGRKDRYAEFLFNNPQERQAELDRLSEEYVFAAGYCRISAEQEDLCSIESQKLIIRDYAEDHPEIRLTRIYEDNGATGTEFDRPGWKALLEDVVRGRISCVIVKDLSRFARNYMEAGYYLEKFFPDLGIRFIAVTDEFDNSVERDSLSVNIRNIINDFYARDISAKTKSARKALMKQGLYYHIAPYGYTLVKEKHRGKRLSYRLEVEEASSGMVTTIFDWADSGVMVPEIAERLTLMGVVKPGDYRGEIFGENENAWRASDVAAILNNRTYTGTYVSGKRDTTMYRTIQKDEDEWIRIPDHHDAIVSTEQFERIRKLMGTALRSITGNNLCSITENNLRSITENDLCSITGTDEKTEGHEQISGLKEIFFCETCGSHVSYKKDRGLYTCRKHTDATAKIRLIKPPSAKEADVIEAIETQCSAYCSKLAGFDPDDAPEMRCADRRAEQAKKRRDEAVRKNDEAYRDYTIGNIERNTYLAIREKLVETVKLTEKALEAALLDRSEIRKKLEVTAEAGRANDLMGIAEKVLLRADGTVKVVFKGQEYME